MPSLSRRFSTCRPRAGRCLLATALTAALLGLCGLASSASVQQGSELRPSSSSVSAAEPMRFDIPRQPLQAALDQYHRLTGQSLLYDGAIADGRVAGPVQGLFNAEEALNLLLDGTGIVARYTSQAAFMLMPAPDAAQASAAPPAPRADEAVASASAVLVRKRAYYAQLQARIMGALCSSAATMPGAYRLALSLWIGGRGSAIERVVLHSTGDARRDARIRGLLTGLPLSAPLPAELVQPVTLLILPRAPAQTGDCGATVGDTNAEAARAPVASA